MEPRFNGPPVKRSTVLNVRLGLRQADDFLTVLPLTALLQNFDPLEAFQYVALGGNGTSPF